MGIGCHDAQLVGLAFPGLSKKLLSKVEVMEVHGGEISSNCMWRFAHRLVFAHCSCMQGRKQYDNSKVVFVITLCDFLKHDVKTLMVVVILESTPEID